MSKLLIVGLLLSGYLVCAQETSSGPVIENFGTVYSVNDPDFKVDPDLKYRVVFDVDYSPEAPNQLNASIHTPARFLNMHAQSGIPIKNMKVALVVHGDAYKDILADDVYNERFQTDNPNRGLIQALLSSGVEIILCGQTTGYQKVSKSDMLSGVQMALSAMTALVQLQTKEYQLIKF